MHDRNNTLKTAMQDNTNRSQTQYRMDGRKTELTTYRMTTHKHTHNSRTNTHKETLNETRGKTQ